MCSPIYAMIPIIQRSGLVLPIASGLVACALSIPLCHLFKWALPPPVTRTTRPRSPTPTDPKHCKRQLNGTVRVETTTTKARSGESQLLAFAFSALVATFGSLVYPILDRYEALIPIYGPAHKVPLLPSALLILGRSAIYPLLTFYCSSPLRPQARGCADPDQPHPRSERVGT